MAVNSISPGWLDATYTVGTHEHHQIIPIIPAVITPGSAAGTAMAKAGEPTSIGAWLEEEYFPVWAQFFNNVGGAMQQVELWSKPTPEDDPIWIWTYAGTDIVGTSASPTVPNAQVCMTFRTLAGGIAKAYLMETVISVNIRDPRPWSITAADAYGYMATSNNSIIVGRDGGFLGIELNMTTKTNDALRKKYLLNS